MRAKALATSSRDHATELLDVPEYAGSVEVLIRRRDPARRVPRLGAGREAEHATVRHEHTPPRRVGEELRGLDVLDQAVDVMVPGNDGLTVGHECELAPRRVGAQDAGIDHVALGDHLLPLDPVDEVSRCVATTIHGDLESVRGRLPVEQQRASRV